MNQLSLRATVRRILLLVFVLAFLAGIGGFYLLLYRQAIQQAEQQSRIMLASATAVSEYTETRILPLLNRLAPDQFHEEAIPFFASQAVFRAVTGKARLYTFRDPTLNPTNPDDRPDPFDVELIRRFREGTHVSELTGVRRTDQDQLFYLARPIRIDDSGCLTCHSTPDRAPPAMVAKYGSTAGYGWTLGEIVGAQVLTVPMTEELSGILGLLGILAGGLVLVFAVAYFALSITLDAMLVRPLAALAEAADAASRSASAGSRLSRTAVREVHMLMEAIDRLRLSLAKSVAELNRSDRARDLAP